MRKAVYAVLLSMVFLLLLSALVVTPEPAEAPIIRSPVEMQAAFHPLVSAALPDAVHLSGVCSQWRPALTAQPVLCLIAPAPASFRDANGHVLTAHRYENSVYQVFHPEIAGG